ncbi:lysine transporter LysE [Vibrio albus]|uniref:Lysine transporter LysE n=1 Tax=Vibrio albus TaxID=2200953 RepID=A0A2U3B717_9VIBR|nr:LysE family translocator [Vibrio albus]PWI32581.1 lysine transporter LysE [Vibrio albus]
MFDQIIALTLFAFVSTFTPGPNNMMLMTSGANIGFIRTLPHVLGVIFGFGLMVFLVGIGATEVFRLFPGLHQALTWACMAYLIYLAVKIGLSRPEMSNQTYRPMSFLSAAMFQWVNPKGWSMALTAVSVYNPAATLHGLLIVTLTFILVNFPSTTSWVFAGQKISGLLKNQAHIRIFNIVMAATLIGSTLPMMF